MSIQIGSHHGDSRKASKRNPDRNSHASILIQEEIDDNQSGFLFINHLGLPCNFSLEG
jgi:hypothetical protein